MIIASRRYVAGQVTIPELPLDGKPRGELPPGTFDWIGLHAPDAAEMALLQGQFGLHPLAVEDALNPMQMPKVDAYWQQLFIVARTAAIEEGDKIAYGQTALFLGRDFIVSVRFGSERDHAPVRARLEAAAEAGVISPSGARDLIEAYDLIARTRLEHQAQQVRQGEKPDNFLSLSDLSDFERSHLRDAFVVVRTMQSAVGQARGARS